MDWSVTIKRGIAWSELQSLEGRYLADITNNQTLCKLIVSEPEATYTYGKNADPQDLLWSSERLRKSGAVISPVSRGGQWTYHGPGQALFFPMMHLRTQGFSRFGVRRFMEKFRFAGQNALRTLGIETTPKDEPFGLYVGDAKIASFGLAIKKGITSHGMSIYIAPQHERFQAIHPCGVMNARYTSVQECDPQLAWEEVAAKISDSLKIGFQEH